MKNLPAHTRRLSALLKTIRKIDAQPFPPVDSIACLVQSFLQWNAGRKAAEHAYQRLTAVLVDHNDLRVSHPQEVAGLLGEKYPLATERAARMHDALQAVFEREHNVGFQQVEKKGRKDLKHYIESLPGMAPYVASRMLLVLFDQQEVPIDDVMLELLKMEGVVEPTTSHHDAALFIARHVKPGELPRLHAQMRAWADANLSKVDLAPAHPPLPPLPTSPPALPLPMPATLAPDPNTKPTPRALAPDSSTHSKPAVPAKPVPKPATKPAAKPGSKAKQKSKPKAAPTKKSPPRKKSSGKR